MSQDFYLGTTIASLFMLVCMGILFLYFFVLQNWVKGKVGELKVRSILKRTKSCNKRIINSIIIKTKNEKTNQIDHILINEYGIFVIETKNWSGAIYGYSNSREWKQYFKDSNKPKTLDNAIKQNNSHIYHLKQLIGHEYPYFSVVVMVQNNMKKTDSDCVVGLDCLERYLDSFSRPLLNQKEIDQIHKQILSHRALPILSIFTHRKNLKENKQNIENNICPRCGSEIIKKTGKYGDFYACSDFPRCRFVKGNCPEDIENTENNASNENINESEEPIITEQNPNNHEQTQNETEHTIPLIITTNETASTSAKLQCSLCGSAELTKRDEFIVCDQCGCKYTLEDAKKMITPQNTELTTAETEEAPNDIEENDVIEKIPPQTTNGIIAKLQQHWRICIIVIILLMLIIIISSWVASINDSSSNKTFKQQIAEIFKEKPEIIRHDVTSTGIDFFVECKENYSFIELQITFYDSNKNIIEVTKLNGKDFEKGIIYKFTYTYDDIKASTFSWKISRYE